MIPLFKDGTGVDGLPTKNLLTYKSTPNLLLNNPADASNDTYALEDSSIQPAWDEMVEPNADRDGSAVGKPRETQKTIILRGWVRSTNLKKLYDKIRAVNRAFNPVLNYWDDATPDDTQGFTNLQFDIPTNDTANWATGLISVEYHVRALTLPVPVVSKFDDLNARMTLVLRAADGRLYEQSLSTANRTGNGVINCTNTKATYPSWPSIIIDFTGDLPTFNPSLVVSGAMGGTISLDYTKFTGHTSITIYPQFRRAQWNGGADATSAITGGSTFFMIKHAATTSVTLNNLHGTNQTTVNWQRAFA